MFHRLRYYIVDGFRGVLRFSSLTAVLIITSCLLIMGSFSLVAVNIRVAIQSLEQNNEIVALLDGDLTDSEAKSVGTKISQIANVRNRIYESREDVLGKISQDLGGGLEGLDINVLVPQYRVQLTDISLAPETITELQKIKGISEIESADVEMQKLLSVRRIVELISVLLIVLLFTISLFIMSAIIKLAAIERREEIAIQSVVGATKSFIRWPFVIQGFLIGLISGLLAFFIEWIAYSQLVSVVSQRFSQIATLLPFSEMKIIVLLLFLLVGFLVGIFGSTLTIRKYLKI